MADDDDDDEPPGWRDEYRAIRERGVALIVARGVPEGDAAGVFDQLVHDLGSEAMDMHYRKHVPHAQVSAWYAEQVRQLAEP